MKDRTIVVYRDVNSNLKGIAFDHDSARNDFVEKHRIRIFSEVPLVDVEQAEKDMVHAQEYTESSSMKGDFANLWNSIQ